MRIVSIGSPEAAWVYAKSRASEVLAVLPREARLPGDFGSSFKHHQADVHDLLRKGAHARLFDDTDILHIALDGTTKRLIMDAIAICRRLQPKLLVTSLPSVLPSEIEATALEFARQKRQYLARFASLTATSFGACVAKSARFLIAIRIDVAKRMNLRNDADIAQLLPLPTHAQPLCFDDALKRVAPNREEEEFWSRRFRKSPKQYQLAGRLKFAPTRVTRLKSLIRTSRRAALPIPREGELLLHPTANRTLTSTELACAWGYPAEIRLRGSYDNRASYLQCSIPVPLLRALGRSLIKSLTDATKRNPFTLKRIQDRYIVEDTHERRVYAIPEDLGDGAGHKLHGKSPSSSDYDHVFDADEIGKDFIVYGPADTNGRPVLVGAVKRGAYNRSDCKEFAKLIGAIRDGTDARADASPLLVTEAAIRARQKKGYDVEVTKDRRQLRQRKKGTDKWGRWRTPKLLSTTYGWTLDKNTAAPKLTKNYAKSAEPIRRILKTAERAYLKLERDEFIKHAEMMRRRIDRRYRLIPGGLFTTLAINCYGPEMPAMNFHIDKNGDESGLATISVFRRGQYDGGLFVLPQYRAAFSVGNGDVFLSNSRKTHGVTPIVGPGNRFSVVSYASTALAADEIEISAHPAKSPRPKFRVSDYRIAIPSYRREKTLVARTLAVLQRHRIDPRRVTIFVASEDERETYARAVEPTVYRNIVVAEPGMMRVRNFMWNYFAEGTPVLFMDDDIQRVQRRIEPKGQKPKLVDVIDLERDVIFAGFDRMREHNAYLWGIYAAANPGFMKNRVAVGLYYVIGSFYGVIIRHQAGLHVGTNDKEDFERSVQHFLKDGRVARLDFVTVKSAYYTQPGGMQIQRTKKTVNEGADYMLTKYPRYVRDAGDRTKGQHKGNREIRLRETD